MNSVETLVIGIVIGFFFTSFFWYSVNHFRKQALLAWIERRIASLRRKREGDPTDAAKENYRGAIKAYSKTEAFIRFGDSDV